MSDLNARCCGPGRVWVFGDDINTDLIFPTTAFGLAEQEQPALVFSANRPGWSGQVSEGDFVVAGKNFGTGSGREIGRLLRALGVAGVIAESLNGLGLRNCVAYGMPVLRAPGILGFVNEGDDIVVDFYAGKISNVSQGTEMTGKALPSMLVDMASAGGVLPLLVAEGLVEPEPFGLSGPV